VRVVLNHTSTPIPDLLEHPSRRFFASMSGRYDSGIPFETGPDFNPATFADQEALTLVSF
jgi:hypothetical protein